jgi:hypothetical protein
MNAKLRTIAAASMGALLAASCARSSATGASGHTVTVRYSQVGRAVDLSVGDTLVVDLRSGTSSALTWSVRQYPSAILRVVVNDPGTATFSFLATHPGTGELLVQDSFRCAGPPSSSGGPVKACPFADGARARHLPLTPA